MWFLYQSVFTSSPLVWFIVVLPPSIFIGFPPTVRTSATSQYYERCFGSASFLFVLLLYCNITFFTYFPHYFVISPHPFITLESIRDYDKTCIKWKYYLETSLLIKQQRVLIAWWYKAGKNNEMQFVEKLPFACRRQVLSSRSRSRSATPCLITCITKGQSWMRLNT